jgi:membrane-associated phospholipid phosphatase
MPGLAQISEKDFAMQSALTVPSAEIAQPAPRVGCPVYVVRGPEWVIVAFLIYAAAAATLLPVALEIRNRVALLNFGIILAYGLLIQFDRDRSTLALSVIRDWLPLGLILLAYREMGWFAAPQHSHLLETNWVSWDRLFLRGGAKAAIEAFGPVLPSILEIAYSLVYALAPFSLAVLYLYGRRDRVDRFLFILGIGVLLCYAQFPFWPSEPPRVVFFGQDLPASDTVFRRFNLWILGHCGIHTSVFPSAHVGAAFSVAFGMWRALPEHKWVSRFLFVMASLIAVATVYGRYHYLADALAGLLMALVALALAAMQDNRLRLVLGAAKWATTGSYHTPKARIASRSLSGSKPDS